MVASLSRRNSEEEEGWVSLRPMFLYRVEARDDDGTPIVVLRGHRGLQHLGFLHEKDWIFGTLARMDPEWGKQCTASAEGKNRENSGNECREVV